MTSAQAAAVDQVVMSARDVSKVYGGTRALRNVDFDIRAGKVTVLFGENGAGKSTLMRVMSGIETPTGGTLILDGKEVTFSSPTDAVSRGVAIIHQELNLSPNLTVAESIFLGRELTRAGMVDTSAQLKRATAALDRLQEPIDPRAVVGDLRLGQQQLVEIARALDQEARVLIMDEPTSALSASEVEVLFGVIRDLTSKGVAVVYISHHLDETLEIGDHAVVLRDGAVVATEEIANIDIGWVVSAMVGRSHDDMFTEIKAEVGEVALEVRGLTLADPSQPERLAVNNLSLEVRAGKSWASTDSWAPVGRNCSRP
ncbi:MULTISPECIES: ATP-binding cassette domain-containing protein [Tessaracoccus]|uniref:ATP-binding cassette domain-containing protein n=1 Tax=Tessaracoccus TaxID=72763 RepID=UPI001861053B|nr:MULTISPECIES: sugar ABC transporter ATP-binding protein [Tessaracoccus]VEP40041.1 Galactose/methyl galactoside import ATP-binding protein MglA [Tessaracoccus lapidicaptus]